MAESVVRVPCPSPGADIDPAVVARKARGVGVRVHLVAVSE